MRPDAQPEPEEEEEEVVMNTAEEGEAGGEEALGDAEPRPPTQLGQFWVETTRALGGCHPVPDWEVCEEERARTRVERFD